MSPQRDSRAVLPAQLDDGRSPWEIMSTIDLRPNGGSAGVPFAFFVMRWTAGRCALPECKNKGYRGHAVCRKHWYAAR